MMTPPRAKMCERRPEKGFSLIEAAIVLGVVGLVIGGIWVAAAAMIENYRIKDTVDGTIFIASCTQNLISRQNAPQGAGEAITSAINAAGCIPQHWVYPNATKNSFDGDVTVSSLEGNRIDIRHKDIPKTACIQIANRLSTIGVLAGSRGTGVSSRTALGYLTINSWYTTNFPAVMNEIQSACNIPNNRMVFTYGYYAY